jgi:predicted glycosyltransferase
MELCYLRPPYFKPDPDVLSELGLKETERFILLRFVSWSAGHDIGETGFPSEIKAHLVKKLSGHVRVFISSEISLPAELKHFRLPVSPDRLHDVLYYSDLYIGEGATTASECAMMGTPAIFVNSLSAGTLEEQERLGLLLGFRNSDGVQEKALELIGKKSYKQETVQRCSDMLRQTIDVTAFMVWFVENYPASFKTMKENPEYQERFR